MKNIFKLILFLCFGFSTSQQKTTMKPKMMSQNGYLINVKTKNIAGKTVKISIYNGNYKKVYKIDSAVVKNNEETVILAQKQKILSAIYQISISGKPQKADVLINNGDKITFSVDGDNVENISTENTINKSFLDYQKMPNSSDKILFLQDLQKKYPNHIALQYFTIFELRKSIKKTENITDLNFKKELLKGINLNDKTISLLPNSYTFLNHFFSSGAFGIDNYKSGVDLLLANQSCQNNNFKFYVEWIYKNLELYQTQDISELAQYIFNTYVNNKSCIENQKKFYEEVLHKSSRFVKLPVGSILPDFEAKNINEQDFKFSEFNKEKINILMFYDPNCEHCKTEVPKVASEIIQLEKEAGTKIGKIAILNINSQSNQWKDFVKNNNLDNWTNVTYKDSNTQKKLDAFENPKFYITDKDGKIIYKLYNLSFLKSKI